MRDLYDVYNMVNKELFLSERNMLRKCIVAYTVISQELIPDEYELSRIDAITLKKVKSDLLPVIQKGEHVPLEQMKEAVKSFLSNLLTLNNSEKVFLLSFKEHSFKPELLFEQQDIIDRLNHHPMIEWKLKKKIVHCIIYIK